MIVKVILGFIMFLIILKLTIIYLEKKYPYKEEDLNKIIKLEEQAKMKASEYNPITKRKIKRQRKKEKVQNEPLKDEMEEEV